MEGCLLSKQGMAVSAVFRRARDFFSVERDELDVLVSPACLRYSLSNVSNYSTPNIHIIAVQINVDLKLCSF